MIKMINVCAIVPNNFCHKAGDGLKTRKHHCKELHPALQANPGSTQATYVLQIQEEWTRKIKIQIK